MNMQLTPEEIAILTDLQDGWEADDEAWYDTENYDVTALDVLDQNGLIETSLRGYRITEAGRTALKEQNS